MLEMVMDRFAVQALRLEEKEREVLWLLGFQGEIQYSSIIRKDRYFVDLFRELKAKRLVLIRCLYGTKQGDSRDYELVAELSPRGLRVAKAIHEAFQNMKRLGSEYNFGGFRAPPNPPGPGAQLRSQSIPDPP